MVPAGATIGQGVALPIKIDPDDPAKIAIDWDSAQQAPEGRSGPLRAVPASRPRPPPPAAAPPAATR
jgi:hypothetical protein